ncbi:MAG: right-handed parallel beta-helix repeat-containing protein [Pyrinomonadaceae bacterium]
MSKVRFTLNIVAVTIFTLAAASMAQAQATRTWVSGVGDDVNPCSRTAPCKTYAGAISKTAKDGEISTLDPGGFGAVTITKSITINGGGAGQGYGSILAASVNGVIINITDAADVRKTVRLDWLNINGASSGLDAIRFIAGTALFVENTQIDGFTGDGIDLTASTQAVNQLHMRNVSIRNVANGVNISNSGSNATQLTMDHVQISKATNGVNAGNGTRGQISYSTFSSCTGSAINATEGASPTEFAVNDSSITASGTGITTGAGTEVLIARVVITGNGTSLGLAGTVHTGGNNTIGKNGTNNAPNGTLFTQN